MYTKYFTIKMLSYILLFTLCIIGTSQMPPQTIKSDISDLSASSLHQKNETNLEKQLTYELNKLNITTFSRQKRVKTPRQTRLVKFSADDESIYLNLVRVEHNVLLRRAPVWYTEFVGNKYVYTKLQFTYFYPTEDFLENFNKKAVLYASERNDRYDYYGVFGEGNQTKVIQTNPDKNQFAHFKNCTDYGYRDEGPILEVRMTLPVDIAEYILENLKHKIARKPFDILYVKLLVVVDNFYYEQFDKSPKDILTYLSVFWNVVQLKFNEIEFPKVEILITGYIIAMGPLKTIYDKYSHNPTRVNLHHFLEHAPNVFKTFSQNEKFFNFDNVVIMTNYSGLYKNRINAGLATVGKVCNQTVTFIQDNARFGGLHEAAHEIGHTLGMVHDTTSPTEEFGPIMSVTNADVNSLSWTKYDLANLYVFAGSKRSWCLNTTSRNN